MIPGIIPGMAGQSGPQIFYRTNVGNATNTGTFNFSSVDIGFPDPTRVVVIGLSYYEFDTSAIVTGMAIGGVLGTAVPQRVISIRAVPGGSGSFVYSALHSVALPSSSTETISITFNRAINYGCEIGVWALYNVSSAIPVSVVTNTGADDETVNLNANTQANDHGVGVATGVYNISGLANFSWGNASERYDLSRSNMVRSGADFIALSDETPRATTVTASGVNAAYCLGIWR